MEQINQVEKLTVEGFYISSNQLQDIKGYNASILRFIHISGNGSYDQADHSINSGFFSFPSQRKVSELPLAQIEASKNFDSSQTKEKVFSHKLSKNKSIFHNFQKHLCSFLKRMIKIEWEKLNSFASGACALKLWRIFQSLRNVNKRKLYIILGINQGQYIDGDLILKLNKLRSKLSSEAIVDGQMVLRDIIRTQINALSKFEFRTHCKMIKIDQFYGYVQLFVEDLKNQARFQRISKQRFILGCSARFKGQQ